MSAQENLHWLGGQGWEPDSTSGFCEESQGIDTGDGLLEPQGTKSQFWVPGLEPVFWGSGIRTGNKVLEPEPQGTGYRFWVSEPEPQGIGTGQWAS